MSEEESAPQGRPRLNLKPRDESAAKQLEIQRAASGKNPFGDAKPREKVLASRTGKSETEILKEEVKSEKPKLRLNASQVEEKRAAESAVEEVQELIEAETSEDGKGPLREELAARQAKLDELLAGFEKLAVEAAIKGDFVRPSERRRQQMLLESQGSGGYGNGDPAAAPYRSGSTDGRPGGYGGGRGGGSYREGGALAAATGVALAAVMRGTAALAAVTGAVAMEVAAAAVLTAVRHAASPTMRSGRWRMTPAGEAAGAGTMRGRAVVVVAAAATSSATIVGPVTMTTWKHLALALQGMGAIVVVAGVLAVALVAVAEAAHMALAALVAAQAVAALTTTTSAHMPMSRRRTGSEQRVLQVATAAGGGWVTGC